MKKLLTAKSLSLLMLLSLFGGKAEAGRQYEDGYVSESRDCCFGGCYECSCNPLYCGAWDLQIDGGVQPITWRNRGDFYGIGCGASSPVASLFSEGPKFNNLFKLPWIVGGQVGYHWSDNTRVYVEFNYSQAKGKHDHVFNAVATGLTSVAFNLNKYELFDAYVGARYYWDRWCDRVAFFLGAKVGLTHHKGVHTNSTGLVFVPAAAATYADVQVYHSNNVVSGGADFGFDICFCGNWSLVIQGAVLASCGPRAGAPLDLSAAPAAGFTNLFIGSTGTELRFPVTFGVRYSF